MQVYWLIFKLAFQDMLEYRLDNLLRAVRYALLLFFMLIIWIAVAKETNQSLINQPQLIAYFTIAAIVYGLSNYHLDYVETDIKLGKISVFLLKPLSPFRFYLMKEAAAAFFDMGVKAVVLIPLSLYMGATYLFSATSLLFFLLLLPLIFLVTFSSYFLVSSTGLWLTQVDSLRMTLLFIGRFLSGMLIPAVLFPEVLKSALAWTPFLHYAYTPIQLMTEQTNLHFGLAAVGSLLVWLLIFTLLRKYIWHLASRSYDAIGI